MRIVENIIYRIITYYPNILKNSFFAEMKKKYFPDCQITSIDIQIYVTTYHNFTAIDEQKLTKTEISIEIRFKVERAIYRNLKERGNIEGCRTKLCWKRILRIFLSRRNVTIFWILSCYKLSNNAMKISSYIHLN